MATLSYKILQRSQFWDNVIGAMLYIRTFSQLYEKLENTSMASFRKFGWKLFWQFKEAVLKLRAATRLGSPRSKKGRPNAQKLTYLLVSFNSNAIISSQDSKSQLENSGFKVLILGIKKMGRREKPENSSLLN